MNRKFPWYDLLSLLLCASVARISNILLLAAGGKFFVAASAGPIASWGRPGCGLLIVMGFLVLATWYFGARAKAAQKVLPARLFI
ncbi:hypothetical protein R1L06_01190 [Stenotrophomonas sp. C4297]|uniref:hypothetical protein n=1 Tax=Stenotrophomonas sp. C4297 TaxID=3077847 RepID=UPI00293CB0E4|nr:hypothetical protein [Stenotrophomonas sp. C4297]MDV3509323.1 hypothetical protein [Stenotrophomonas sp. C4297]HEL4830296.1 hypothetical protein [Stenotrophomonas maltophilia]